ncbi:MAG: CHASE2 domain-containing protein, partial [Pseudomonadales bacterium]|nr:CHASE2 domain-containing protein [Pseudomonadales bacterium]
MQISTLVEKTLTFLVLSLSLYICQLSIDLTGYDHKALVDRFKQVDTPASNDLLIIEIDDKSIKHFNNWPWPRSIYAQLLRQLQPLEPKMLVFDIDFSSPSSAAQDREFAEQLAKTTFPVVLASFIAGTKKQKNGQLSYNENKPIEQLVKHVELASANALVDQSGLVFKYITFAANGRPTIANLLANRADMQVQPLIIDFSIDPYSIPRVSFKDVITGNFSPQRLAHKKLLLGSTSIELGDMFALPKYGRLPGVIIHALGYETLIRDKQFSQIKSNNIIAIALLIILISSCFYNKKKLLLGLLANLFILLVIYFCSIFLHHYYKLILPTSLLYIAVIISLIAQIILNVQYRTIALIREINTNNFHKALIDQMIKDSANGIIITDHQGVILVANKKAKAMFCIDDRLINAKCTIFDHVENSEPLFNRINSSTAADISKTDFIEMFMKNPAGKSFHIELLINKTAFMRSSRHGRKQQSHQIYDFMVTDITEKMRIIAEKNQSQVALVDLKYNDPLTKLPNKYSFDQQVNKLWETKQLYRRSSLMLINLDSIKEIKQIYGLIAADSATCQVARELKQLTGERGSVCRFSDTVFSIVHADLDPKDSKAQLDCMRQVYFLFSKSLNLQGQEILMSVSIGMAIAAEHGGSVEILVNNATAALDYVKTNNTLDYFIYEEDLANKIRKKSEVKQELVRAIRDREFVLFYQPQHAISDDRLLGFESLIRWQDPNKGLRFPDDFIPIAEECGLINQIGEIVLELGCHDAAAWPGDLTVAINVSPSQFDGPDMAELCIKYLKKSG